MIRLKMLGISMSLVIFEFYKNFECSIVYFFLINLIFWKKENKLYNVKVKDNIGFFL